MYTQSEYEQPGYTQEVHTQLGYTQEVHTQPRYTQAVYTQPWHILEKKRYMAEGAGTCILIYYITHECVKSCGNIIFIFLFVS